MCALCSISSLRLVRSALNRLHSQSKLLILCFILRSFQPLQQTMKLKISSQEYSQKLTLHLLLISNIQSTSAFTAGRVLKCCFLAKIMLSISTTFLQCSFSISCSSSESSSGFYDLLWIAVNKLLIVPETQLQLYCSGFFRVSTDLSRSKACFKEILCSIQFCLKRQRLQIQAKPSARAKPKASIFLLWNYYSVLMSQSRAQLDSSTFLAEKQ